jgi:hypothetical protein
MVKASTLGSMMVAALALPWAGCGKSAEVAVEDFGAEASAVMCDKVYACCQAMELVEHADYSGGRDACGTKTRKSMGFWAGVIAQERDRGRLAYDPALARQCLDGFGATTCEAHKRNVQPAGCDRFITPKTAPGGACRASESCMGGACVGATADAEGTCRAFSGEGLSCKTDPCEKGLYCEPGSRTCQRPRADGEACHLHAECQSAGCNGRNPDAGTPGTCGLKGGEQTTCFVTTGCSFGGSGRPGLAGLLLVALVLAARRRRAR